METTIDYKSLGITITVHMLLLFFLAIYGIKRIQPSPASGGIVINFGDQETGHGEAEPRRNNIVQEASQAAASTPAASQAEESYMTQDHQDAVAIKSSPKTEKKTQETQETKKPVEQPTPVKKEEKKEEKKQTVNSRALYRGKSTDSQSTGSEGITSGQGNQGSLSGSEKSTNYALGMSAGDGVSFSLAGRNPVALPSPRKGIQKEGVVVVEITVDRSGQVVAAIPGVKGSTTYDEDLLDAAKKAALSSRFSSKSDAAYRQKGTIKYIFRLK